MPLLTEATLSRTLDVPVSLPITTLEEGDWITVAQIKVVVPMSLSYRYLNLTLSSSTVPILSTTSDNQVNPNLGIAYVALFKDYDGGNPNDLAALSVLSVSALTTAVRTTPELTFTEAGIYTFICVNNMQSTDGTRLLSPAIDLDLNVSGTARVLLEAAVS